MKKLISLVLALTMALTMGLSAASAEKASIRVGMVTDVGGVNDQSFNQLAWEGMKALHDEDPSIEVQYLESKTDADYQTNINTFIDEGYDLIISVGYMLAEATREAALDNPDQLFAILEDESNADLPNVACLMFAQEQAGYLVGLVAGSVTKTKIVGYVQGMVSENMNRFGVGFVTGVKEACPDATIEQYNANSFTDIAGGNTAAKEMITKGADVIFHAAGLTGMGVINACDEAGIWAIGVDTDQSILAPDHVITSVVKRVDVASQDITRAVKAETFTPGVHVYDLSNGAIDLAPTRTHLPEEVLKIVEDAKAAFIAGEKTIPTKAEDCPDFILK